MIIVFSGLHGTGKSTVAKEVAGYYKYQYYSSGNVFRDLAKEKGMDLKAFSLYAETHPEIDLALDNRMKAMAQKKENYVFDGQLPAFLLGDLADFRILLQCDDDVRLNRMTIRDQKSLEAQKQETLIREKSERQRFIEMYGIDISDTSLIAKTFNLILDTTFCSIPEVVQICIYAIDQKIKK